MVVFAASLTIGQNTAYAQNNGGTFGDANTQTGTVVGTNADGLRTETTTTGNLQTGFTKTVITVQPDGSRVQTQQQVSAPISAGSGVGTCLIGQTLANFATAALNYALDALLDLAVTGVTAVLSVPVKDWEVGITAGDIDRNNTAQTSKEVGIPIKGVPILPSLDSIGYCIVNSLIEYISDATINWINSGFEGNPVFIDNFDDFFKNLADRELSAFINNVSLPGYMCEPFQVNVQLGLLEERRRERDHFSAYRDRTTGTSSTGSFGGRAQCSLDSFLNGGAFAGGTGGYTTSTGSSYPGLGGIGGGDSEGFYDGHFETVQNAGFAGFLLAGNPANTPMGSYNLAVSQVKAQQQSRQEVEKTEIVVNDGVRSPKDEDGNIETPGKIIQSQISKRLGLDEDRLVLAKEFDEIVTALVNALVKIALDKILPDGSSRYVNVSVDGVNPATGQPYTTSENAARVNIQRNTQTNNNNTNN